MTFLEPFAEPASPLDRAWIELERTLVSALLVEIEPREAIERMKRALEKHLGLGSTLLVGHHPPGADDCERILIGNRVDDTAMTLVISRRDVLDSEQAKRLKRIYELLVQIVNPIPRGAHMLHQLRNRLAGLQANIEFVELVAREAQAEAPSLQNDEVLTSLSLSMNACREISKMLRTIQELERGA